MVGRGAVGPFDGDLDDYQRYLLDEAKRQRELAKNEAAADNAASKAQSAVAAPKAVTESVPQIQAASAAPSKSPKTTAIGVESPKDLEKPMLDGREQRKLDAQARQQQAERLRPLKRELEQIDKRLAVLSAERNTLQERLNTPLLPAEIADCGRRLKAGEDESATLEDRWLELSSELESATAVTAL